MDKEKLIAELEEAEKRGELEILQLPSRGQDEESLNVYLRRFPMHRLKDDKPATTVAGEITPRLVGMNTLGKRGQNSPFRSPVVGPSPSSTAKQNVTAHFGTPRGKSVPALSRTVRSPLKVRRAKVTPESVVALKKQLEDIEGEICSLGAEYSEGELQSHIEKLHEYNEIKDVGQILLGKLAEVEGVTSTQLYGRFGLQLDD